MKQILIISSAESEENKLLVESFAESLNRRSDEQYRCTTIHYDDIAFEFGSRMRAFSLVSGTDMTVYDFVYFKSYIRYEERAFALAVILKKLGVPFVCSEVQYGVSTSKISQYAILASENLPLPKTLYIPMRRLNGSYDTYATALGLPFVLKAADGKGGEANFLIKDREAYAVAIAKHENREFVGQSFVTNSGDLRVLVVNGAVQLVIGRARKDNSTHLNNTSQGANANLIPVGDLSEEAVQMSLKAASVLRREIAGVDVMFEDVTNKPYILEVNASPQVGSGAFTEEKLEVYKNFFVQVLKNSIKSDIISD